MLGSGEESARDEEQPRYERARKQVETLKGFHIHATTFELINIALSAINVLLGGRGGSTGRY